MKDTELTYGLNAPLGKDEYSVNYLKYLLSPFNVTDSSLRTVLSRMQKSGVIESIKYGIYFFNKKGKKISQNVAFSFRSPNWDNWNNTWWGFIYSLPSTEKALRHKVRTKLLSYRFSSLYPGCWIRPLNEEEKIEEKLFLLSNSDYGDLIKMNFQMNPDKIRIQSLWNIKSINMEFTDGIKLIEKSESKLNHISSNEAFVLKMCVGNVIVKLLFKDPLLPDYYLPDNWMGMELRKYFFFWEKRVSKAAGVFIEGYKIKRDRNEN